MEKLPQEHSNEKSLIKHNEIAGLKEPLQDLLEQLKEKIESGYYNAIIGDDASGRIPALIVDDVITERYKEKGFSEPRVNFFAGSRDLDSNEQKIKEEKIGKLLDEKVRYEKDAHVLIVTDTIKTGISLKPLTKALKERNVKYDIATISIIQAWADETHKELEKYLGATIYYANNDDWDAPNIYGKHGLSGVKKKVYEILAEPTKKYTYSKTQELYQRILNEAREDVAILSQELIRSYKASLPKQ